MSELSKAYGTHTQPKTNSDNNDDHRIGIKKDKEQQETHEKCKLNYP